MMLVAIPEKPITVDSDGTFKITMTQPAEKAADVGRFRISVKQESEAGAGNSGQSIEVI